MELEISGEVFWWRGPSPYHFVAVPEEASAQIEDVKALLTYGWGVIPVTASIGDIEFTTSLIPKDGRFLLPLKDKVRQAEALQIGDPVTARLHFDL